jgi:O-antigen biosynthesis protein
MHQSRQRQPFQGALVRGVRLAFNYITGSRGALRPGASYAALIRRDDTLSDSDRVAIAEHLRRMEHRPLISVVMPVYQTPERLLTEAVESVRGQLYPDWELCIADDGSPSAHVGRLVAEFARLDERIKWIRRPENGHISAATNSALGLATGEFVAFMDHDDLLCESALYEVAVEIAAHPDVDILYSDEDRIDDRGRRFSPYFKPDFNPELLLGQNMVNHLGVYRRQLIERIGGLREGFEGSQDYDLTLRAWAASSNQRIRHIPKVLYHWRAKAKTASFSEKNQEQCAILARKAIQEFLDQEGQGAKVLVAPILDSYSRIVRKVPKPEPLVSVIVPTKDQAALLSRCVEGILKGTEYPNLELLIVDHDSRETETLGLLETLKHDPRVRIVPYTGPFNYSAMNNLAATKASGEVLALVNNDIEVVEPQWLNEMVAHATRPEIGAVGAKLLYPDGRVQHAGVVVGIGGVAGHSYLFARGAEPGYFGQALLTRAVSAVTGACLVVRKSAFLEVGGLNADDLTIAFNDIDFCLKLQARGYRNVWTPFAQLVHHESASRGREDTPEKRVRFNRETEFMRRQWREIIENDPFYNPNLTLDAANCELAASPRRQKPWRVASATRFS